MSMPETMSDRRSASGIMSVGGNSSKRNIRRTLGKPCAYDCYIRVLCEFICTASIVFTMYTVYGHTDVLYAIHAIYITMHTVHFPYILYTMHAMCAMCVLHTIYIQCMLHMPCNLGILRRLWIQVVPGQAGGRNFPN